MNWIPKGTESTTDPETMRRRGRRREKYRELEEEEEEEDAPEERSVTASFRSEGPRRAARWKRLMLG